MEPAACSKRQGGDLFMKEKAGEKEKRGGKFLLISIVLVFACWERSSMRFRAEYPEKCLQRQFRT